MNTAWIRSRQTQFGAYATFYIVIVVAALILVNYLANRHNKSIDTTAEKKYSLSDQTEKVVKNLKQDVQITYVDEQTRFTGAKDLLDRYDNLSTRVKVNYLDPDKKPEQARLIGARNLGNIFVQAGGRKEEAKSLTEEEVTGAIIRLFKNEVRTVCSLSGSGEAGLDSSERDGYANAKTVMEGDNFRTKTISLLDQPQVPGECTVVIVPGPKFDYVDPVVQGLKKYVEGGGRLLVMLDSPVKVGNNQAAENPGLVAMLAGWGVTANKDLVLDSSGVGTLFGFSAAVPLVSSYESHPIVRDFQGGVRTAFPLARSLDVKDASKTQVQKLFSTGRNSFAVTSVPAGGEIQFNESRDKKGPLTIAAAGNYDTGQKDKQGRFVVVGSSSWANNAMLRFNGNRDLLLNALNWLSSSEELISIRPKDPADRRLNLNTAQVRLVYYSTLIFLPLVLIAGGVSVWWKRR